ncbi:flagellar hook-basal body complex protein FliE [Aestuariivita sp.]|jgi:flagellar hook-basal body complex protein FliE|uniref:flagellar hook-basal body complex protein FliE n=1 Tax=Aestuariivita sp. TaxID=1872407 RepID=UPI002171AC25|nr:flagellar hook-basal body complex protein FliE [Aestuariivita sp.]MCE8007149.1 flagellar hook-basal body complex protein FliE [Aestuariivita sp.]
MDIRDFTAAGKYAAARPATEANPQLGTASSAFASAAEDFANTLRESETLAKDAMSGNADPHALVQALAQTELAVETAVTVRNRVVEAYQEILRMPV